MLLDEAYKTTMGNNLMEIRKAQGGTIVIDGATNILAKSMRNLLVRTALPPFFFIEYLRSDLRREAKRNVVGIPRM